MATVTNPWLTGLNAPVHEELTATELEVVGELPAALDGRYVRNGPNPVGEVDPATYHWFTGDAMVHGVRLRDGRAEWYRNRWVRSTGVSEALGEEPAPGPRHGGFETANTNVIGVGGRTFAIVEAGACPVELTAELDTIAHNDFDGTLPHGYTAHPKVDPVTGDLHAIAYHWALDHLEYVIVGPDARVRSVEPIPMDHGPMVHDCSITEKWMVVYDMPVSFSMDAVASGASFPYVWNPDRPARLGLVPLGGSGAAVRWFEVEPCYVFHPLNAFDDTTASGSEAVVLDVVRHPKMFDANRLGPDEGPPTLWRWTIDLDAGTVTENQMSDVPLEFPRVDERVVGRRHGRGWATEVEQVDGRNGFGGRLVAIDAASGGVRTVDLGAGRLSGEWVMVPASPESAEDDGWLMAFVWDPDTDRSELVVLPAAEPDAGPVARVLLPHRVPAGFHGNWVPA